MFFQTSYNKLAYSLFKSAYKEPNPNIVPRSCRSVYINAFYKGPKYEF